MPRLRRSASLPFILVTMAIDALCFGIIIPVLPDLVREVAHAPPARTSLYLGLTFGLFSLMQFLGAPVLGGLSDRFGRRPVLLISLALLGVNALLWLRIDSLAQLIGLRVYAGLCAATVSTASAYIGDVTPPERRASAFGLLGAMFGAGFIAGPVIGGLLGSIWIRLPFLASFGLIACNLLYGLLLLPESLPPERRRPFDWRRANAFASLRAASQAPGVRRPVLAWCCSWLAISASQTSFILANQLRFGWSTVENGLAMALAGLSQVIVQVLLMRLVTRRLGVRGAALVGYGASVAGFLVYAGADRPWIMLLGIPVLAFGALGGPAVQSIVSAAASANRQGEIQGTLASLQGLMLVIGPPIMGSLFALATRPGHRHFVGAPFLLSALISAAALLAMLGLPPTSPAAGDALPEGEVSR